MALPALSKEWKMRIRHLRLRLQIVVIWRIRVKIIYAK